MSPILSILVIALLAGSSFSQRCSNYEQFLEGGRVRPLANDTKANLCYYAFEQGPCAPGEWFQITDDTKTINTTRPGICEKRLCPENSVEDQDVGSIWVHHKGKCLKTGVQNSEFCGNASTSVYFTEEQDQPSCSESRPT